MHGWLSSRVVVTMTAGRSVHRLRAGSTRRRPGRDGEALPRRDVEQVRVIRAEPNIVLIMVDDMRVPITSSVPNPVVNRSAAGFQ